MTKDETQHKPRNFAALKNVAAMMGLVHKLQSAALHLDRIGVFHGPSGYGKTRSTRYARNRTNAVLVEVKDTWTKKSFLKAVLFELGVQVPRGTIADMEEEVIRRLGEDLNRPLIIDEADRLVDKGMIELVRSIYDGSQAPVILVGEEVLPAKLSRIERVHNRVTVWTPAQPCDLEDVRKLAEAFYPRLTIEDALLEQVRSETRGVTRRVVANLERFDEWARNRGTVAITSGAYDGQFFTGATPLPRTAGTSVVPLRRRA